MPGSNKMFTQAQLKGLKVAELKKSADALEIHYPRTAKKADLIKLILEKQKVNETVSAKKEDLIDNPSSQTSQKVTHHAIYEDVPDLPNIYGKNKMVFMVRDPLWGFTYWEVTQDLRDQHGLNGSDIYLRVYDITENGDPDKASSWFDIKVGNDAMNWYIKFPAPNKTFIVDYGYIRDGQFVTVLRSNPASTPRDDVSDQTDQEWMLTDEQFRLILQASGADSMFDQTGSQELMKFIAGNVEESLSSGGASLSSPIGPYSEK
jgi:hypothetical protein